MAKLLRLRWQSDLSRGLSRRDKQSCSYDAYLPDRLQDRQFRLDADVAADVADAEAAITRLNLQASALVDTEALARLLLRAESVASSRIEGLEVGARRLLRAEVARGLTVSRDITANEVLANIDAMAWASRSIVNEEITLDRLLEIHRRLLAGSRLEAHGGSLRQEQNWIGGSSFNPCSADFIPPPPEFVPELIADLCAFCNLDSLPATVQAAVAHAHFETIHPFVDGNGRTGRALIHLILRRRGLARRVLPPVSLILATRPDDYILGLSATRYVGSVDSIAAHDGLNQWIATFAGACRRAVEEAEGFETRVQSIESTWRERAAPIRLGSAVDLLLRALPGAPILSVSGAAQFIGRSFQATNGAIERLVAARILVPITVGNRNRAFEAPELIDAFTDFERQLASLAGDTRVSAPNRRVPPRRPQ
jgi:Fic family protein